MANTTNYNWETPDDTDLVKDGAAAIRTLGSSADTTVKNLNPETTLGDIAYRSSSSNVNTRLAVGSTNHVLTVASGVPSWAAGSKATLTTTGDILYASAANTPARLGIGSAGQVLTVASGIPSWAAAATGGGMTQIATGTMSGSTFSLSSFSGYKNLQIVLRNYYGSVGGSLRMRLNNDTTVANYYYSILGNQGTYQDGTAGVHFNNGITDGVGTNSGYNNAIINIFDYAQTTGYKLFTVNASYQTGSGTQTPSFYISGVYEQTSELTSVDFVYTGGGNNSGGTYIIYGVQ